MQLVAGRRPARVRGALRPPRRRRPSRSPTGWWATASAAEDISQEAFLSIWRSRLRYDPTRGSVRTWVLGIVHHRAIDALRRNLVHDRRRASAEGIEERLEAPERTDVEVARREEARTVRAAHRHAAGRTAKVIELAYFGGFTHTQIAEMLEMPIGTVKGRMRLGLEKLRRQLAERGGADGATEHDADQRRRRRLPARRARPSRAPGLRAPSRGLPRLPRGGRAPAPGRGRAAALGRSSSSRRRASSAR